MSHLSDGCERLKISNRTANNADALIKEIDGFGDVCVIWLPTLGPTGSGRKLEQVDNIMSLVAEKLKEGSTLVTIGEAVDLVHAHQGISNTAKFQLWIAVKKNQPVISSSHKILPNDHFGCSVHTKYTNSIEHTKTRVGYSYCPVCDRTTKDYGGKKHTYHEYGTLLSDVWRDISADVTNDISPVIDRLADFFGIARYKELRVIDCRKGVFHEAVIEHNPCEKQLKERAATLSIDSILVNGDCLEELRKIPSNSIDFAFADPPYNLGKHYANYADSIEIADYFKWCDEWLSELERVLKPGRTCVVLNIPLWAIRHFTHLEKTMCFQNWIVWDALSFPVRMLMPAHYAIICFTKGAPRSLPGLHSDVIEYRTDHSLYFQPLHPLQEGYCLRADCVTKREKNGLDSRVPLSDIWWDIHRLKHNTRRVDHPCQLPPELMYRLISVFSDPGEIVLDCFNGAGTTTLTAAQLGRRYYGIEKSEDYHKLTERRHKELADGLDPFRKEERILTVKNSPVKRMPKQKYKVPKRTLQLEVKRISKEIGHIPNRHEVECLSNYPIKYYDEYFVSWGEVCAAARTTGMTEKKELGTVTTSKKVKQLKMTDLNRS